MKKFLKPALLLAAIAIMVIGMLGSGAWFTDTVESQDVALKSGTLDLRDAGVTSFVLGNVSNLAPGDITEPVTINIINDGTLDLAWIGDLEVTAVGESGTMLKEAIYIEEAKMEFIGTGWDEPTDQFITAGKGSGDYPTSYNAMAAASKFGLVTLDQFDQTNAMGVNPYEFTGALRPGYSYRLTLQFGMAPGADDDYQGLSGLTLGFNVKATQVKAGAVTALSPSMINNLGWYQTQLANQQ